MAKYTEAFKSHALVLLFNLKKEGTVEVDMDIYVNNVRELVKFLGISSYTLYKWYGNTIVSDDSEQDFFEQETSIKPKIETIFETDKIIMELDNTYFMTLARALKIKNYRMPLKQLYLAIGNELIKRSGLVENGVREELRI